MAGLVNGVEADHSSHPLFQGQFRSTITCRACGYRSVTFDAFMYLSVPLPSGSGSCSLEVCSHPCACVDIWMRACVYIYVACVRMCVHVYKHVCTYVGTCVCVHVYRIWDRFFEKELVHTL